MRLPYNTAYSLTSVLLLLFELRRLLFDHGLLLREHLGKDLTPLKTAVHRILSSHQFAKEASREVCHRRPNRRP